MDRTFTFNLLTKVVSCSLLTRLILGSSLKPSDVICFSQNPISNSWQTTISIVQMYLVLHTACKHDLLHLVRVAAPEMCVLWLQAISSVSLYIWKKKILRKDITPPLTWDEIHVLVCNLFKFIYGLVSNFIGNLKVQLICIRSTSEHNHLHTWEDCRTGGL